MPTCGTVCHVTTHAPIIFPSLSGAIPISMLEFLSRVSASPAPPVPLPRKWVPVDKTVTSRNGGIKVISYNVLNEAYATHQMYPYCPSWALDWKHRKNQVLRQVLAHDADVICLQEVAVQEFSEFFKTELARADYAGVFKPKSRANTMSEKERRTVDGCAIFYRRSRFSFEKAKNLRPHELHELHSTDTPLEVHRSDGRALLIGVWLQDYGIEFSNVAMQKADMRAPKAVRESDAMETWLLSWSAALGGAVLTARSSSTRLAPSA